MLSRSAYFVALVSVLNVSGRAELITFDDLASPPPQNSSQSFFNANGGSDTLDGVTFPSLFAVSGNLNVVTPAAGPFLNPHSGNFAGFGFGDTTIITSLYLQDLYLGNTSLASTNDGVSGLTIQALDGSNEVLGSVAVTGLTVNQQFVDTSAFNSLSGIAAYRFRIDSSGSGNTRFSVDDLRFAQAVPEPTSMGLMMLGLSGLAIRRGRRSSRAQQIKA